MTRCVEPGCYRKPIYPDQNRCESHRIRWTTNAPTWMRRIADPESMGAQSSVARDWTGRSAA